MAHLLGLQPIFIMAHLLGLNTIFSRSHLLDLQAIFIMAHLLGGGSRFARPRLHNIHPVCCQGDVASPASNQSVGGQMVFCSNRVTRAWMMFWDMCLGKAGMAQREK